MPDFVSDTRIYWNADKTGLVEAGDKDAGDFFCGVGGVVYEDHAKRLGLLGAAGGLTARGKELGYLSTEPPPERPAGDPRAARSQREARPESVGGSGA